MTTDSINEPVKARAIAVLPKARRLADEARKIDGYYLAGGPMLCESPGGRKAHHDANRAHAIVCFVQYLAGESTHGPSFYEFDDPDAVLAELESAAT
jgi:hypothetical protein